MVYPSTPATFQGQDQLDLFKPVVKWNGPVFEWTRIPELVRMAFREMLAGRPGPVHLDIPGPVLYATGDAATALIHPSVLEGHFINDLVEIGAARSVPTVAIMNSWDNPSTKRAIVGMPDWLLVWGSQTKMHAERYMRMPPARVVAFGSTRRARSRCPGRLWSSPRFLVISRARRRLRRHRRGNRASLQCS